MNFSSWALFGILLVGMVLFGCTQPSGLPSPNASAQASVVPDGSGSSIASPSPTDSASSAPADSDSSYLDESTVQGVDSTGSDLDELEQYSDELSAGDVEYSDDAG